MALTVPVSLTVPVAAAATRPQKEPDAGNKALEAFQQNAARAGYVKAHEALANRSIYRAHGKFETAVVLQELAKGFAEAFLHLEHLREIKPHEICAFKRAGNHLGQFIFQEAVNRAGILVQICTQLIQPLAG